MSEYTQLLVATNNKGKVRELSQLLSDFPLRLRLLGEFPDIVEAEETGETFAENASIKALHYSAHTRLLTLSDDSGLVVDALGGAPGVRSARYAGREATYAERMSKLLGQLDATGDAGRRRLRLRPPLHPRRPRPALRRTPRRGQTLTQPPRPRVGAGGQASPR